MFYIVQQSQVLAFASGQVYALVLSFFLPPTSCRLMLSFFSRRRISINTERFTRRSGAVALLASSRSVTFACASSSFSSSSVSSTRFLWTFATTNSNGRFSCPRLVIIFKYSDKQNAHAYRSGLLRRGHSRSKLCSVRSIPSRMVSAYCLGRLTKAPMTSPSGVAPRTFCLKTPPPTLALTATMRLLNTSPVCKKKSLDEGSTADAPK